MTPQSMTPAHCGECEAFASNLTASHDMFECVPQQHFTAMVTRTAFLRWYTAADMMDEMEFIEAVSIICTPAAF